MEQSRRIIEMKRTENEEGRIRYARASKPAFSGWLSQVAGITLGVVIFLTIAALFICIALPVAGILILLFLLRNVYLSFRRK